ncbi:MAG: hypothetical protein HeimC3_09310 [Candidatus Heimdallarchaeota archaeon LC_3]|nr:MAG: hypothetical protein HeimC3_09310 [Candidatus Heimdallarchaeota archaeon LC_3]
MFCPNCKAIYERVRTEYGIQQFCNCEGKRKADFFGELNKITETNQYKTSNSLPIIISERKRKRKRIVQRSNESINIPLTRSRSDYDSIPVEIRIYNQNTYLPSMWNKGKVGELLVKRLNDIYERFYRKFEDFFINKKTELRFLVFLEPKPQMTEFYVFRWGVGALEQLSGNQKLIRWYQGTKLPLDWSAKIREKEGDYISPINHFSGEERQKKYSDMNYLTQIDWFEKLIIFWDIFKEINKDSSFFTPTLQELYEKWKIKLKKK